MEWTPEALKEFDKVPVHVREMARMGIEEAVEKKGKKIVDVEDVKEAAAQFRALMGHDISENKTTRIAVIRCEIVSETCPGVACFRAFNKRKVHFEKYGKDTEMIGFLTCGGCPGRRIFRLVDSLLKHDVDVIHLSSCMMLEKSYAKCPHIDEIKAMILNKGVKLIEGTHH